MLQRQFSRLAIVGRGEAAMRVIHAGASWTRRSSRSLWSDRAARRGRARRDVRPVRRRGRVPCSERDRGDGAGRLDYLTTSRSSMRYGLPCRRRMGRLGRSWPSGRVRGALRAARDRVRRPRSGGDAPAGGQIAASASPRGGRSGRAVQRTGQCAALRCRSSPTATATLAARSVRLLVPTARAAAARRVLQPRTRRPTRSGRSWTRRGGWRCAPATAAPGRSSSCTTRRRTASRSWR